MGKIIYPSITTPVNTAKHLRYILLLRKSFGYPGQLTVIKTLSLDLQQTEQARQLLANLALPTERIKMTGLVIHHMQPVSDIYHPKTNTAAPGVFYLYSCRAKKCQLNKLWANIKSPVDQLVLTSAHLPHEVLHSTCAQIAQKLAAPRAQSMNITASVFF